MPEWVHAARFWISLALSVWWYVILPALVLAGCYVYLQRNAATHFGMARDFEEEGNLEEALKHYELAARYAKGKGEGRAAQAKVAEVRRRIGG